ncbi:MAG: non-heme iron oxygenase ferredoxin subunit [Anaerolineaceae bacterium]|nr:non-heme iron oxygenase ferredoxin subunit [Anaerolineaceae bacterium]
MSDEMNTQYDYFRITTKDELPDGERLFVEIGTKPIVIFALNGQYFATSDECSHDGGPIGDGKIEGFEIICPRHGARFDIRTGKATRFPAVEAIAQFPVRVVDGYIEVGIPA